MATFSRPCLPRSPSSEPWSAWSFSHSRSSLRAPAPCLGAMRKPSTQLSRRLSMATMVLQADAEPCGSSAPRAPCCRAVTDSCSTTMRSARGRPPSRLPPRRSSTHSSGKKQKRALKQQRMSGRKARHSSTLSSWARALLLEEDEAPAALEPPGATLSCRGAQHWRRPPSMCFATSLKFSLYFGWCVRTECTIFVTVVRLLSP
mmetsp:Transcript_79818/g.247708  ORF Transcript_79818/g.247708 Transcript_79818/m.247708 type:complete len:203 (-) Transcript_79818:240-848(-)